MADLAGAGPAGPSLGLLLDDPSNQTSEDDGDSSSEISSDLSEEKLPRKAIKKKLSDRKSLAKRSFSRKHGGSDDGNKCAEVSEMQLQRNKNIDERMRFFNQLALDEAKKAFEQSTRRSKKPRSSIPQENQATAIRHKSERIQSKKGTTRNHDEKTSQFNSTKSDDFSQNRLMSDAMFKPFNSSDFEDYFGRLYDKLQSKLIIKTDIDLRNCSLEKFDLKMQNLCLKEEQNMKVVPCSITAMAIHPSKTAMLTAAGSKSGSVGLWNVNVEAGDWDDSNLIVFEPHKGQISSLSFSKTEEHVFYTTSYDGTVRRGDLNKQMFEMVYSTLKNKNSQSNAVLWHCEQTSTILYAAQEAGNIARIDTRIPDSSAQKLFRCHFENVRTISLNPKNREQLLTCSDDSNLSLWDLRMLSTRGMSGRLWSTSLDRAINSAFFSPITGSRILATLGTDAVCIMDTQSSAAPFKSWELRRQSAAPTRPLSSPHKAVWHPQREDAFAIARAQAPFGIEVFQCNHTIEPLHTPRTSTTLETQRCNLAEFHPSLPAVAGSCITNIHLFL